MNHPGAAIVAASRGLAVRVLLASISGMLFQLIFALEVNLFAALFNFAISLFAASTLQGIESRSTLALVGSFSLLRAFFAASSSAPIASILHFSSRVSLFKAWNLSSSNFTSFLCKSSTEALFLG